MLIRIAMISVVVSVLSSGIAAAQAPASAPAGSTGLCNDGTYSSSATKRGACSGHKGVQTWYGASGTSAPAAAPAAAATPAAPAAAPAAPAPAPAAAAAKETSKPVATQASGGGPGLVWVNTKSNVYHCPSDSYYGKTKSGLYMSEADAIAKGAHAAHGKACK
jgi:Protein of unknown function (DUF3761)